MTGIEIWVVFTLGLISSLHCVQMCGPIVLSYSVALDQTKSGAGRESGVPSKPGIGLLGWVSGVPSKPGVSLLGWASGVPSRRGFRFLEPSGLLFGHLAYNAGRILTYAFLGALAGFAGKTVGLIGRLAGISSALAIIGGVLMLIAGLVMFGAFPAVQAFGGSFLRITSGFLRPFNSLIASASVGSRFLLGLALGLLPCGLIYAALLRALATGSALWGATTMAAFGAGTASALLAVGIFSSAIRGKIHRWGSQLAAASVMAMGALLIVRGTMPGILAGAHAHVCH